MVSIIILSYNTKDQIGECLTSLFTNLSSVKKEVIIVDNASTDGSTAFIKEHFPKVAVIQNIENVGFAKGCNIGAAKAQGETLVFLNSDTRFLKDSLSELLGILEQQPKVGVVGGNLINTDGTYQESFGSFHSLPTIFTTLFFGDTLKKKPDMSASGRVVDWVTGAYMVVRKNVFIEVNGFDEGYFMYIEDMDLCFRIRKKGHDVYFLPSATLEHKGQGSSNRSFAIIHIYKGILYFFRKHRSILEYYLVYSMLWLKAMLAIGVGIITRNTSLSKTYREALKF